MVEDIVIIDGARTAIGTFGGSLAAIPPIALAATAAREALARAGVEGGQIGHVVFGHVINTEPRDMYLSRVAAMEAGVPDSAPAMNVNRLCGSGAQAIVSACRRSASATPTSPWPAGPRACRARPTRCTAARWGQKMGDTGAVDMMVGALTCPFGTGHMGVTAENVAAENGDHPRGAGRLRAREPGPGRGGDRGGPVRQPDRAGRGDGEAGEGRASPPTSIRRRRPPRRSPSCRPAFRKDGTVTAGNASGLNDGAAALVLATAGAAAKAGLAPHGAGARLCGGRGAAGGHGHRADPGSAEAPGEDRALGGGFRRHRVRTRPSPPRLWR